MKRVLIILAVVVSGLWLNNSSLLVWDKGSYDTRVLAHRGVHQIYMGSDRNNDTCRAENIYPVTHPYIENTLPSMQAAFDAGADVVEIDLHLTTDNVFSVFHDWRLDCQTDGTGVTHKQTFEYLKSLDLGYGFSDGAESYPLRATGVGLIPSLEQVFDANLPGPLLLNFKSNRRSEGRAMVELLKDPSKLERVFAVYGGVKPTQATLAGVPGLRGYDKPSLKSCLIRYGLLGWSGYVPHVCRDTIVAVPSNFGPYLWGWPHRFTKRMGRNGTDVFFLGPYDRSGFSSGIDTVEQVDLIPDQFDGYVWTNRVEVVGPLIKP